MDNFSKIILCIGTKSGNGTQGKDYKTLIADTDQIPTMNPNPAKLNNFVNMKFQGRVVSNRVYNTELRLHFMEQAFTRVRAANSTTMLI